MRVDLTIDCNAPERAGWIAYAVIMILLYPVGIPILFGYLLLVRFRENLEYQRDKEQIASETRQAARHVDRMRGRQEASFARRSARDSFASGARRASNVSAIISALQQTSASCSSRIDAKVPSASESSAVGAAPSAAEKRLFTTAVVWGETASVLNELEAQCTIGARTRPSPLTPRLADLRLNERDRPTVLNADLSFLLNPYLLRCYWFEVFECLRKICLVGFPVFFVDSELEQLMLGLVVCFITQSIFMSPSEL